MAWRHFTVSSPTLDLHIEAPGAGQSGVQLLREVRRRHHQNALIPVEPSDLVEQLIHGLVGTARAEVQRAAILERVDFVDEDDAGRLLASPFV